MLSMQKKLKHQKTEFETTEQFNQAHAQTRAKLDALIRDYRKTEQFDQKLASELSAVTFPPVVTYTHVQMGVYDADSATVSAFFSPISREYAGVTPLPNKKIPQDFPKEKPSEKAADGAFTIWGPEDGTEGKVCGIINVFGRFSSIKLNVDLAKRVRNASNCHRLWAKVLIRSGRIQCRNYKDYVQFRSSPEGAGGRLSDAASFWFGFPYSSAMALEVTEISDAEILSLYEGEEEIWRRVVSED